MSFIVSIGTAIPKYKYQQSDISDYMIDSLNLTDEKEIRKLKVLYKKSAINYRYSVLPDFKFNGHAPVLFGMNGSAPPSVQTRLKIFEEEAYNLSRVAITDCISRACANSGEDFNPEKITHLITVSCTGMSAPGLEIEIVRSYGLNKDVTRLAVNFMGCYGAFHALKIADAICRANANAMALIVCVELCTLHFQKETSEDCLLANTLFADGSATLLITGKNSQNKFNKKLRPDKFTTQIVHKGERDMAWRISSSGFLMTLTSHIPYLVNEGINELYDKTMGKTKKGLIHYAIHPGGKKIIDKCAEVLNLKNHELATSLSVLEDFGNMSAPTVLFVLKKLWDEKINWSRKEKIFGAGFGPGLTMEAACLTTIN